MTVSLDPFPTHLLEGCETALVVFAAGFGGQQDAAHIRDAGLHALCVDDDESAIERMRGDYPDDWTFTVADAFERLDQELHRPYHALKMHQFDVVTLDPYTGPLMDKTIEALPDFCRLARKLVVVGVDGRQFEAPDGWRIKIKVWRSPLKGGVYWAVLVPK